MSSGSKSGMVNIDSVRTGISDARATVNTDPFFQTGAFIVTTGGGFAAPLIVGGLLLFYWLMQK